METIFLGPKMFRIRLSPAQNLMVIMQTVMVMLIVKTAMVMARLSPAP